MSIIYLLRPLLPISPLLVLLLLPQSAIAAPDEPLSESTISTPTIFIGHSPKNHYVILIPTAQDDLVRSHLARIRDKMSTTGQIPFISQHSLGQYIYVGSFTERSQAENTRQRLLNDEPRARVMYFP